MQKRKIKKKIGLKTKKKFLNLQKTNESFVNAFQTWFFFCKWIWIKLKAKTRIIVKHFKQFHLKWIEKLKSKKLRLLRWRKMCWILQLLYKLEVGKQKTELPSFGISYHHHLYCCQKILNGRSKAFIFEEFFFWLAARMKDRQTDCQQNGIAA